MRERSEDAGSPAGAPATGGSPTGGIGAQASGGAGRGGSDLGGGSGSAGEGGSGGDAAGAGGSGDVPDHDDFIVRSRLMSAYEGLRVFATFDHNFGPNSRSAARSDVISNGTFEVVWVEGFNRDSFGAYVVLFVDRGNDWTCSPDVDPAWVDFRSNLNAPGGPEILDFDPESDDANFGPISCEEFNTWFDHDYRPPPQ